MGLINIGIAGVGGIGSNVAANLARSGFNHFTLVDFDLVEESNLNRQFYFADQIGRAKTEALAENLRRIAPNIHLSCRQTRIEAGNCRSLFSDCTVIVEGFDGEKEKKMLLEELAPEKELLVSACGIAGCDVAEIGIRRLGNCVVAGDFISNCQQQTLYAHKLQAVCAWMSEAIVYYREHGGDIRITKRARP